jgi:hypothetical protein
LSFICWTAAVGEKFNVKCVLSPSN